MTVSDRQTREAYFNGFLTGSALAFTTSAVLLFIPSWQGLVVMVILWPCILTTYRLWVLWRVR